ncbi:DUF262 domain-containing protein [Rhodococcus wratislaviensis]|uniref:GmrSD restriction endonucleases N-terminal domain-containing protein n=1 Tax=Rhodococcus wratislaviensis NBRC 100605 TaxID=1219028 RepID=X0QB31_RHOWR|nr:DUF262 domain-containing protein [Rhodococcus wratislaviensis]GAF48812.1 hypothetical protein RW1_060_00210 [Rhodococcus wratislaviensis NBRC 100605]
MSEQTTRSRNEHLKIQELVANVRAGKIRVPEFQRAFRWDAEDVLALFDSILQGYPFGSLLLWKRSAPHAQVRIGALRVDAPATPDALWVVDGQQRITSLVNAVDPEASAADERFQIVYSLDQHRFISAHNQKAALGIPLPALFDLSRAFAWLQENPDAAEHAAEIQRVTALLRDVEVSASVIEQADEHVLREVFDRINSAGKRLRGSEIFDAIHSATDSESEKPVSIAAIADRLDQATDFGRLDEEIVYQAILVRRHPDITRDAHNEFSSDRSANTPFPAESQADAYEGTELALESVIRFLKDRAGIPHVTFVPFRFHLLVLTRFFSLYSAPSSRNLELLGRWFWRSTAAAPVLGYTGSTGNIRTLAALVEPGDESGSVQRLLDATHPTVPVPTPRLDRFRTNHSSGKVVLAALWARGPANPVTGQPLSHSDLAAYLLGETSAAPVALEIFPRRLLGEHASSAANRAIAVIDRDDFAGNLRGVPLDSLLLDEDMVAMFGNGDYSSFLERRMNRLARYLRDFLDERTGVGFEVTPPLSEFDFDEDEDEDNDDDSSSVASASSQEVQ